MLFPMLFVDWLERIKRFIEIRFIKIFIRILENPGLGSIIWRVDVSQFLLSLLLDPALLTRNVAKANEFNRCFENVYNLHSLRQSLEFASSLVSTISFSPQEVLAHQCLQGLWSWFNTWIFIENHAVLRSFPLHWVFSSPPLCTPLYITKDWVTANVVPIFSNVMIVQLKRTTTKLVQLSRFYSNIVSVLESNNRISSGFHKKLFKLSFIVTSST